jgi:hypothetical protein
MKNNLHILKWATEWLVSKGYSLQSLPETVARTPWSNVIRIPTTKGDIYLKQTPAPLFLEPKIMQLLTNQLLANVPLVIARNDDLHCFLMKDGGQSLRQYLKTEFQPDLLCQAIRQYTAIQRLTENHIASFLALGVPDWRLDKLPKLYDRLISETEFLKADGMTGEELQILHDLSPKISEQCELLAQYKIPETLVQPDFNTNNTLLNQITHKITFVDLGEITITHPFFSLDNYLLQATIHHGVKELDQTYNQLQNTYCENWLELGTKKQLLDMFMLVKKLMPIYSALALYRLMTSIDMQAFKTYYANRPNRLAECFRKYIGLA